jgi:hypothetical protein
MIEGQKTGYDDADAYDKYLKSQSEQKPDDTPIPEKSGYDIPGAYDKYLEEKAKKGAEENQKGPDGQNNKPDEITDENQKDSEGKPEEINEEQRLAKVRENFLFLLDKQNDYKLFQVTDPDKLIELLCLPGDYTKEQLERSLNVVDDLLKKDQDYDRRQTLEKYLRDTANKLPTEGRGGEKEEIDENARVAKVRENFRHLLDTNNRYDLYQINDEQKLLILLCLEEGYTIEQLERSLNVADDVLSDDSLDYDRRMTAQQYLRNIADKLRAGARQEKELKDGEYAIKFKDGKPVEKDEIPFSEGDIPPEHALVRLEHGELAVIENGKPEPAPKEKILIADVSEVVKAMAWRLAENKLNQIVNNNRAKTGDGRIKGFFKSQIARMGERGYLSKFYYEALEDIRNNQDLLTEIRGRLLGRSETVASNPAKVEQWKILDEVIREMEEGVLEGCEKGEEIEDSGIIFADLINRHIAGEFSDRSAFEAAAREAIENAISSGKIKREQFVSDTSRKGEATGEMYASNLYQIAEAQRAKIEAQYEKEWSELSPEQRKKIAEHLNSVGNLDIRLATKLRDINEERPERPDQLRGYLRGMDRIAGFARSRPILGLVVNPTTLGFMSSLAVRSPARMAAMAGAGALGVSAGFGLPILVGAGLGAAFAYARRRNALAYDRGMEQRREALGQQGQGRRAERIRQFGFSGIGSSAEQLLAGVNSGDAGAVFEAAALFQAERELRDDGRPVDLITTETAGDTDKTNYVPKTELKIAIRDQIASLDKGTLDARVNEIRDQISQQDKEFEGFRREESRNAAFFGAAVGAVAGVAAIEIRDWIQEKMGGDTGITFLEYLKGERPAAAHYEFEGQDLMPMDKISRTVTMPETGEKVDISYRLDYEGRWMPVHDGLPTGYAFDADGNLVHSVEGTVGGPVTAENWDHLRGVIEGQHGELLESQHVGWSGFGYNENAPSGDSFTDFYIPRAEGTELQMDFIAGQDGSVTISAERMLGNVAFSHGKEVKIDSEILDKLVATISPRDRVLQHEALVARIQDGKVTFPKELAEKLFDIINGKVEPKSGIQITLNQVVRSGDNGSSLYSLAEDHAEGPFIVPPVPPVDEMVPPPSAPDYIPPTTIVPPVVIPFDRRKPIGDVERGGKQDGDGKDEKKKGKVKVVDDKNKVNIWAVRKAEGKKKSDRASEEQGQIADLKERIASTSDDDSPKEEQISVTPAAPGWDILKQGAEKRTEAQKVEVKPYDKVEKETESMINQIPLHEVSTIKQRVLSLKAEKDFNRLKSRIEKISEEQTNMGDIFGIIPVEIGGGWKYALPKELSPENQKDVDKYLNHVADLLAEREKLKPKSNLWGLLNRNK